MFCCLSVLAAFGSVWLIYRKESVWDDVYNINRTTEGPPHRRWNSYSVFGTSHMQGSCCSWNGKVTYILNHIRTGPMTSLLILKFYSEGCAGMFRTSQHYLLTYSCVFLQVSCVHACTHVHTHTNKRELAILLSKKSNSAVSDSFGIVHIVKGCIPYTV